MKTQTAAAVAALMAVAVLCGPASAQHPDGANAPKFGIAVVDINYIFKNHQKFKAAMDGMKTDFQAVESQMKQKQQALVSLQEKKKGYKPGSPEFKQIDEQLVRANADLQVEVTGKRKELVEREAQIYYSTYREVSQAIKYYADRQNIGLVLRFNGEDADPANRESILRNINKAVHYQNKVDITPDVLSLLNRAAQANRGGTTPR